MQGNFELQMRKLVKNRITWWDAIIEIKFKEIKSFLTSLWLRMQFIKTIIWPKMWLSSLHCCQFVLICVILSCTKGSEIDQAVKWCPIISLGLGGHNDTITMMDAHLKTLSVTVSSFLLKHPSIRHLCRCLLLCGESPWPGPYEKHQEIMEVFFLTKQLFECWSSLSPRIVVLCDRLQPDSLLLKRFLAPQVITV